MPVEKAPDAGRVNIHASFTPISTPLTFAGPSVAVCAVGSSVCLFDTETSKKEYIHTSSYSISKVCGNPDRGLVAFCEGGTNPRAFVYQTQPPKLLFTLSNITELELADMAFSRCGTRLYTLSRATSKRLNVFSTLTGQLLPGCEISLPQRFDKVAVFHGHKDRVALVRSSVVRIVTIQKSYETYIMRLLPNSMPADADLSISAYSWLDSGRFVLASRQGAMVTLDGNTGAVLHACQASEPISSITTVGGYIVTAHLNNLLKVWTPNEQEPMSPEQGSAMMQQMPPMEGGFEPGQGAYVLGASIELDSWSESLPVTERLYGQVAYLQATPNGESVLVTTAEGEVWAFPVPRAADDEASPTSPMTNRSSLPVAFDDFTAEDLQLRLVTWYHTHPISDALFLGPSGRVCASCDEGGRLRLWELTKGDDAKGFRTLSFTSALTTMAVDYEGHLLLAGTDTGCIHLIRVPTWQKAHIIQTMRLSESGVSRITAVTHESGLLIVAVAFFNNKIAFLSVPFEEPELIMQGFSGISCKFEDFCFSKADFEGEDPKLIVVGANKENMPCMWMIAAPPLDYEASISELSREDCPIWSSKLSSSQRPQDKAVSVASLSQEVVLVGFANGATKTFAPPTSFGPGTKQLKEAEVTEVLAPHGQYVTRMTVSDDALYMYSSSMDGCARRTIFEDGGVRRVDMEKIVHNPFNGGAIQAVGDAKGCLVLTTGGTDGVLVWSDPRQNVKAPEPGAEGVGEEVSHEEESMMFSVDDKDEEAYPVWKPISLEEQEAKAAAENDDPELNALVLAQRRGLSIEVEALRKKLRMLIDHNATCQELEQLDRADFCVDFEERDEIAKTTKERCDELRAQIEKENVARQMIRDRLIKEFWEPMRGKGCQITSLASSLAVSNYPERIVSDEENTTLRKLRCMRQVEHLENGAVKGPSCPAGLKGDILLKADEFATGEEGYIVNWWHENAVAKKGEEQYFDQKYLYEPFELMSNCRRRLQIHLLQSLAVEYRQAFNKLFTACQSDKQGILDQIKEKVTRTKSILNELAIKEEVPEPALHDHEDDQAVLNVKDREIKAEKWISPEEKAAIEEAQRKEEERQRLLRENDAGTRALQQMMGGTLKTKKDLTALEITLDKEAWMDEIPEEEMSELQLIALKEFREKEKALAEEQDKYRKQLDAELKKLKTEIQELTDQFEKILKELHHQRFAHDAKFFCQELYCVRLQLALLQSVEDGLVLKQSTKDVEEARAKLQEAEQKLEQFQGDVAAKKARQDDRMKYEREVSSAQHFRQAFANSGLEPEAITALLQLFRKRKPAATNAGEQDSPKKQRHKAADEATNSNSAAAGSADMPSDSYPDLGTAEAAATGAAGNDEDVPLERPEGVEDEHFQQMLELRQGRMEAEAEVQKGAMELQEMHGLLAHLQKERDDAAQACRQLEQELQEHSELMKREEYDIEILFKLKQGQVEVPQAAVVTDYSDAIVIQNDVVESRNSRILELGKDKVSTLETIKEFRKKLSLIQWEYQMLQLQTTDLEERTKDVHMLRVTKDLQSLLKGGEEGRNKAETDLLERKIEHLKRNAADKEAALKKRYAACANATKVRKMENSMLEKKLKELQQNVIQREHIRRLRAPTGGGGGAGGGREKGEKAKIIGGGGRIDENEAMVRSAQQGFREIRGRQTLMDAAKRHTEEIDLLTKELDRLRQKTFPSFIQLHQERGNPDHR